MAEKKICDVCHQKVNGINNIANYVEGSMICSRCYDKLKGFKILKKYTDQETLKKDEEQYLTMAKELEFPQNVIDDLALHFEKKRRVLVTKDEVEKYLMTTGSTLEGYVIEEYLGIVSGHVVIGTGFFSSFDASVADFTGSEASGYMDKLDLAKQAAQLRAIKKSLLLGGNALVGVDLEYTTFVNDLIGVVFTGTSVKVRKKEDLS